MSRADPFAAGPQPAYTKGMGELEEIRDRPFAKAPFGEALVAVARREPRILALSADLAKYTDLGPFVTAFPERFFNVGMAEQALFGVAAGLAKTGFLPFATTYAVFATRRAYDFIAIQIAKSALPVAIVAALPGLTTGYGTTHQGNEDLALMAAIPGLTVVDPCDATEIAQVVEAFAAEPRPLYLRILRGNVPVVLDPASYRFAFGRARVLREPGEIGIVATGLMTERALDAAEELARQGLAAGVLHVPCLVPFDAPAVVDFARRVQVLVTAENHQVEGGLGTRVVEALYAAGLHRPLRRVGIPMRFVECGTVPTLQARYGLTAGGIVAAVRELLRAGTP
ncbi:MAG: transketolase C-terminal domain-containing protein [Geminicoccaceae bacterium]|nr:transketolase family protein [Geminicoccaceae bacterium]MDW8125335.1 transketolase C-terminal domain-containing protein [Geminicoccaceae bacterium]MDW8342516.1 transketolase C-terminal domain-containing protein [Geminicoccaceae bacterium]